MTVKWNGKQLERLIEQASWQVVVRRAQATSNRAVTSILTGPKTGVFYGDHQASAPGEAPADWRGGLVASSRIDYNRPKLEARVVFDAPYALALEYGTEKMEPRPYLRPAFMAENQVPLAKEIEAQVRAILRNRK